MKAGDPRAHVEAVKSDSYPVQVRVMEGEKQLWAGPQRRLFQKYAADRQQSIAEIKAAVSAGAAGGEGSRL